MTSLSNASVPEMLLKCSKSDFKSTSISPFDFDYSANKMIIYKHYDFGAHHYRILVDKHPRTKSSDRNNNFQCSARPQNRRQIAFASP
jgi:hypothetical protein